MSDPVVTVVVVAHSVRDELERCFASVRDHAEVPVQVVLVDNGSTDDTRAWVARAHPEVEVVALERNLGVGSRDEGLKRARGRYTLFLDSDARLTPGALPAMVRALDEHPGWVLVGPRLTYEDGRLQLSARRFPPLLLPLLRRPPLSRWFDDAPVVRRHLMADEPHDRTRPVLYVLGACQLFRTAVVDVVGPFGAHPVLSFDDVEWCLRLRRTGGEVVYLPEAVVVHEYRRLTAAEPVSKAAAGQLWGFVLLQWRWRRHRRAIARITADLDRRAAADRGAVAEQPAGAAA